MGYTFTRAFDKPVVGYFYALVLVITGMLIGGSCALLISRNLFGKKFKAACFYKHTFLRSIDKAITEEGWKIVFLMRLTPVPFSLGSYLLGLTSLKLRHFLLGSCASTINVIIYLYIGYTFKNLAEMYEKNEANDETLKIEVALLACQLTILITVVSIICYKARKEFHRHV